MSSFLTNYTNNQKPTITSSTRERLAHLKKKTEHNPEKPQNKWKEQHVELISQIRAAKKFQAYVNGGGIIRELPQPPPSENPDYIQCPHCLRRFNKEAAARHVPKCTNYRYNKSKVNRVRL